MAKVLKTEKIKSVVIPIAQKYNIKKVDLFGSYANGAKTKRSDIDLLVDFNDETMSLFKLFDVQRELEKGLGKRVDIIEIPVPKSSFLVIDKVIPIYG